MNYRNKIENSEAFKNLEGFKKNIYKTSDNIRMLTDQIIIARTIGYDKWKTERNPGKVEDAIVKELSETF